MWRLFGLCFLFLSISSLSNSALSQERDFSSTQIPGPQEDTLMEILGKAFKHYNRTLRPNHFGPPLQISVSLYITEIPWTSEAAMEFGVDMVLRQSWTDARLEFPYNITPYDNIPLGHEFQQKIWTPDTFFPHGKHSTLHSATLPNQYFRLYSSGRVISSIHLALTSSCPMNLVYFPMDYQICSITMESFAYDDNRVSYDWDSDSSAKFGENAFGLLQNYQLTSYRQRKGVHEYLTGNYSFLKCELQLSRYVSYYVVQMYIPMTLVVVISWLPFWMGRRQTDWERITIGVTTILTMASLVRSIQQSTPKVSYITAMDVYTQTSFLITFLSLLESAAVCYLYQPKAHAAQVTDVKPFSVSANPKNLITSGKKRSSMEMSAVIDNACRIFFPASFGLFNVAYWLYYLTVSASPKDPSWVPNIHAQTPYTNDNTDG